MTVIAEIAAAPQLVEAVVDPSWNLEDGGNYGQTEDAAVTEVASL